VNWTGWFETGPEDAANTVGPQFALPLPFQIDHIIAEQHEGETVPDNLALACPHCNRLKGPNIAGIDPASGQLVRVFHPRTDAWAGHFQFDGARISGRTAIGRVTVQVLAMNAHDLLRFRIELIEEGISLI
jgi:HNH endonuclease